MRCSNLMLGLLEAVAQAPSRGSADLLQDAANLALTEAGVEFVAAGLGDRKKTFRKRLPAHVPLAPYMPPHARRAARPSAASATNMKRGRQAN